MVANAQPSPSDRIGKAASATHELEDTTGVYWLCQLGGWGLCCAFQCWTAIRLSHVPVAAAIGDYSLAFVLLVAGTHALRLYSKHHRWMLLSFRALVIHALFASVI